jgi:hypothetical protein
LTLLWGRSSSRRGQWTRALLYCAFTAKATDTGDTCNVYVDVSPDGGTTWINAVHFTEALGDGTDAASEYAILDATTPGTSIIVATADAASTAVRPTVFGNAIRARWVIVNTGTADASFTFSVKAFLQ